MVKLFLILDVDGVRSVCTLPTSTTTAGLLVLPIQQNRKLLLISAVGRLCLINCDQLCPYQMPPPSFLLLELNFYLFLGLFVLLISEVYLQ